MPKIQQLLPNDFPEVTADEKRSDIAFLLEDGSVLMLEFESNTRFIEDHLKYMHYAQRILQRYFKKEKKLKNIKIVVIYTSDVRILSRPVLLSEYDGDEIMIEIRGKIDSNKKLTSEDLFKLSFLPLMYNKKERNEIIIQSVELAKRMKNEHTSVQVIAGILTSTDKFIDQGYAKKVREWLRLTKVGRIFEEEKQEAVREAEERARQEAEKEAAIKIAKSLLEILTPEVVAEKTGLTIDEVKKINKA
ncbi:hypothetical protein [Heyndrickxia acidiproducens]|uniref:hypothetical protein n=1 Tax=Heyndrickxia acidiproducens TaxID=1121084 RepID=UPI00036A89CA|nr:hypothetical protein [Heyndrickxia acidiproducens]